MRHPTRQEIDKFNGLLNLHEEPLCQDWEIECSSPERLDEFLELYRTHAITVEERFTLMALILGAFEHYHALNPPKPEMWNKVKSVLMKDIGIHRDHIEYYQCFDEDDGESIFPITKRMREIKLN